MSITGLIIIGFIIFRIVRRQNSINSGKGAGTGRPPEIHTAPAKHREQRTARPQQRTNVQRPAQKPEMKGSTMAYLEEKAKQDEAEHAREKWEEARRLNQNYGGLRVAQRLFEGDSVPGGQKCVVCGYCGAENLVPMMPRERYSCYFCREPLG